MNRMRFGVLLATVAVLFPVPLLAQTSCDELSKLALSNASVTSATLVPAGPFKAPAVPGQPAASFDLPAHCRVAGVAKPTSDSEIKFEVWLPAEGWNGKLEQVGNGGFAGTIPLFAMATPLMRGYATAGTDDGHSGGQDVSWAIGHPEKVIDFGYRAVHETSLQAKAIAHAFYGKDPARSYFVGCSDGGREALMEAQRYPADFGGIIAGAPANYWTTLQFRGLWDERALNDDPASAVPPKKLPILQNAALAACDMLDGVKDGLIENPRMCHFDPAVTQCKGDDSVDCLTAPQVAAVRKVYAPLTNPRTGELIAPGFSPGAEAEPANWQTWITGGGPAPFTVGSFFANAFFSYMVFENPKLDIRTVNFDSDVKKTNDKLAHILNSTDPNLHAFRERGGKLIQYAGWGDAAIPPEGSVDYFESVQAAVGDTTKFYRLFMVPGMSHCGGGMGANVFGNLGAVPNATADNDVVFALDRWVETGKAPDQIIAARFVNNSPAKGVEMTRPLCPYPQQATYRGTGDIHDASNFVCKAPSKTSKK
jgi:tannase/feruloyl esterase